MFDKFDDNMLEIMLGMFGGSKTPVEDAEKSGQARMIAKKQLPIKANSPHGIEKSEVRKKYEELGIEILSEADEYFYNVKLPPNIEIKATEHAMWNEVYQDGKEIASFFYKASFYDKDAFINFKQIAD